MKNDDSDRHKVIITLPAWVVALVALPLIAAVAVALGIGFQTARDVDDAVQDLAVIARADVAGDVAGCQRGNALRAAVISLDADVARDYNLFIDDCRDRALAAGREDPGPVEFFPPGIDFPNLPQEFLPARAPVRSSP